MIQRLIDNIVNFFKMLVALIFGATQTAPQKAVSRKPAAPRKKTDLSVSASPFSKIKKSLARSISDSLRHPARRGSRFGGFSRTHASGQLMLTTKRY